MKSFVRILPLVLCLFAGLNSCIDLNESVSTQSYSDDADSVCVVKGDSTWYVSLFCRTIEYDYGKQLNVELVVPDVKADALPVGKFSCRSFSEPLEAGTFISGYFTKDEQEGYYNINGSHILMNMGYQVYNVLFETGSFEIKNGSEGKYDFSFVGRDSSGNLQFSINGDDLKVTFKEPENASGE